MFNVIEQTTLTMTPRAVEKVLEVLSSQGEPAAGLRVYVAGGGCSGFKYGMSLEAEPTAEDEILTFGELRVFVDPMAKPLLTGANVDYVDDAVLGQGFKIDNPNAQSTCGCGQSFKA